MKKIFTLLLAFTLLFSLTAFAENEITITVNNAPLTTLVPPAIVEGRTMVPMRAVFEALGASVTWDGNEQLIIATSGTLLIVLKIGSDTLNYCDIATGETNVSTLDVAPFITDGRTLVPLRAVSEALGASVLWDGDARSITITK